MRSTPRLLLHAFSTFKLGGPQARFVRLANTFGSRYRHLVMAMDGDFAAGERLDATVPWEPVRLPVKRGGALANRPAFRRALADLRPDLLLSYNWGAMEWAAANWPRRVDQVHVEDGFGPEEAAGQLPRRVWTRRVLLGWTATPVVVASRNLERIATGPWKLPADRVRFIANGVALGSPACGGRGTTGQPPVIGTLAGLRPEKNVARLIRAFAAARERHDVRLVIVGDGAEREPLESLARRLGVESAVEFRGYLPDPSSVLRTFDLFALSSDTEQLPLSLLEAMAAGMPVVATRVGDVPDVLGPELSGCLAAPDDEDFRRVLCDLLADRARWPHLAAIARARVEREFAVDRMIEEWSDVFEWRGWVCGASPHLD